MLRILNIVGTRPEAIKMAPVIKQLGDQGSAIQSLVCSTGQHQEMLDKAWNLFKIQPDFCLKVMKPNQSLSQLTSLLLSELDNVVQQAKPNWILAQGDTTTAMAAALTAFYHRIPFGHIEAGLRTYRRHSPFPEEINRRIADLVAELLFAPTQTAEQHLLAEGIPSKKIRMTGNTIVDAAQMVAQMPFQWSSSELSDLPETKKVILVTAHRRESFGKPLENVCQALRDIAQRFVSDYEVVFPVHPNPNVSKLVTESLKNTKGISLLRPLNYQSMIQLIKRAKLIITDSGGIQEEAPAFGVPVLVIREFTERTEAIEAGAARLVGTDRSQLASEASELLTNEQTHAAMAQAINPYGDGHAASRVVESILNADIS